MPGSTALVIRNIDFTFTSCSQSHSSSVVSRKGLITIVPAWLNRTFTGPQAASTEATAALTSSALETSATANIACPPAALISATIAAEASAFRSIIATRAPSAAKSFEAAPPIPVAPPEMMAVLCARRLGMGGLLGEVRLIEGWNVPAKHIMQTVEISRRAQR